jgi:hypothetical protein
MPRTRQYLYFCIIKASKLRTCRAHDSHRPAVTGNDPRRTICCANSSQYLYFGTSKASNKPSRETTPDAPYAARTRVSICAFVLIKDVIRALLPGLTPQRVSICAFVLVKEVIRALSPGLTPQRAPCRGTHALL